MTQKGLFLFGDNQGQVKQSIGQKDLYQFTVAALRSAYNSFWFSWLETLALYTRTHQEECGSLKVTNELDYYPIKS